MNKRTSLTTPEKDNLKKLYSQLRPKHTAIKAVSELTGLKITSVRNVFGNSLDFDLDKKFYNETVKIFQNQISVQNNAV